MCVSPSFRDSVAFVAVLTVALAVVAFVLAVFAVIVLVITVVAFVVVAVFAVIVVALVTVVAVQLVLGADRIGERLPTNACGELLVHEVAQAADVAVLARRVGGLLERGDHVIGAHVALVHRRDRSRDLALVRAGLARCLRRDGERDHRAQSLGIGERGLRNGRDGGGDDRGGDDDRRSGCAGDDDRTGRDRRGGRRRWRLRERDAGSGDGDGCEQRERAMVHTSLLPPGTVTHTAFHGTKERQTLPA
jgi:hypothetical protein